MSWCRLHHLGVLLVWGWVALPSSGHADDDHQPLFRSLGTAPSGFEALTRAQSALVDGWKLNVSEPPGRAWLFDLANDPNEQRDLAAQRPDKLAELQAALAEHNAAQAPPAWPSQASFPVNIDKDLSRPDAPDDEYIYWSN